MHAAKTLIQVIQRLAFACTMADVMKTLSSAARTLTDADGISVVLVEGDESHYVEEDAIGPLWKGKRFPLHRCISGECIRNKADLVIEDVYADRRIPTDVYRKTFVASMAMVPIRRDSPIGAIGAYWRNRHRANEAELDILNALADAAALAIPNVERIAAQRENDRRRDLFLSMLAHELRGPLAPIRNATQVLSMRGDEAVAREWALKLMDRQIAHLSRLVDDLLQASRVRNGKLSLETQRTDLCQLLRQCVEDRRGLADAAGLVLKADIPGAPVRCHLDAVRMVQAVGNIIENAIKYTPHGTVTVRLAPVDANGMVVITVADTGIGISAHLTSAIFEPFTQADASLDRSEGGLGLGLSVAKALIEMHGGNIAVSSDGIGHGACFSVSLPIAQEPAALESFELPTSRTASKRRVLVIEDNRDSAESLKAFLEIAGLEVDVAYDGRKGVQAAQRLVPDIVLCDIGLPDLDGYAVATTLKTDVKTAAIPLVAVTGYGDDAKQRILGSGFFAHLVKPVDPRNLLDTIDGATRAIAA